MQIRLGGEKRIACEHQRNVVEICLDTQEPVKNVGRVRIEHLCNAHPKENNQPKQERRLENEQPPPALRNQHGNIGHADDYFFPKKHEQTIAYVLADQILKNQPDEENKNADAPVLQDINQSQKARTGNRRQDQIN